jgi:hypothetical protein
VAAHLPDSPATELDADRLRDCRHDRKQRDEILAWALDLKPMAVAPDLPFRDASLAVFPPAEFGQVDPALAETG